MANGVKGCGFDLNSDFKSLTETQSVRPMRTPCRRCAAGRSQASAGSDCSRTSATKHADAQKSHVIQNAFHVYTESGSF